MTAEQLLLPVIEQHLARYTANGQKIRLKSKPKKIAIALIPHAIFFVIGLFFFLEGGFILSIGAVIFAIRKAKKIDNKAIILKLAAQNPKTPVETLIKQEVTYK